MSATATTAAVDYATWQSDVKAVIDQARPYVEQRTANAAGQKLALVFDIDNTTLETDFHPWYELPTPAAVKPSLDLARYARSRGVDIFFISARPGIISSLTEWNLTSVGYPVSGLYTRDLPDLFDEVSTYKTSKRAEIESRATPSSPTSATTTPTSSAVTPSARSSCRTTTASCPERRRGLPVVTA